MSRFALLGLCFSALVLSAKAAWEFGLSTDLDLYAIKKSGTDGNTEVHVVTAESEYAESTVYVSTLPETNNNWDFILAPNNDLYGLQKSGTDDGKTELHILSIESEYKTFTRESATGLDETNDNWNFALSPTSFDLYCIQKSGTDSAKTEVSILTAESDYKNFSQSLPQVTGLDETPVNWEFLVGSNNDLYGIQKSGAVNFTVVYTLTAASDYKDVAVTETILAQTPVNWQFLLSPDNDLYGIQASGTNSDKT